ncbi:MAG: L-seryl-tRNA(Sec) selenium transferase [Gammaproteobacteria bacterium]|nr:L-seryl-tRNA(Sec) selenium transferase [Gammaproteobacteria bacterium]MDP2141842.1 L-seryl-tRNA(Sec) selenium transferase [Gammaproteobacteria bacterium]MDP2348333.1 L-seryl-tRNA(Sec) selenium transferase [Gammaproteobacteria bacterium]
MATDVNYLRSRLPSIDKLLNNAALRDSIDIHGHNFVRDAARDLLAELRTAVAEGDESTAALLLADNLLDELSLRIRRRLSARTSTALRPVFNLTGTVIHTNLGRSTLPQEAINAVLTAASGPVDLEFDLDTARRGDRDIHLEHLLCDLTGAEAATVVNNNAAAVLLVLQALASGKEVILSRGELVEVGGSFRIPEVMQSAGCVLREVGTSNRTHLKDYANAINAQTGLLMRVHASNYVIQGFTASVASRELVALAHAHNLPLVNDLGSGTLVDMSRYGLPKEPTVGESLAGGADIVTFSGDKLLGGPQAGIIVGSRVLIDKIRSHPLKRALRVDKLTIAALTEVLRLYQDPRRLAQRLPVLRDLVRPLAEIQACAQRMLPIFSRYLSGVARVTLRPCRSQIGSGALPMESLESVALCIESGIEQSMTESDAALQALALALRRLPVPIVGRISDGAILLDLRCLRDEKLLTSQLAELAL